MRNLAALLLLPCALGISAVLASPEERPPAPAPPAEKPRALPLEEFDRLMSRAERNLVLHGLSLDPRFLARAVADYRGATQGIPGNADADRRFSAFFAFSLALACTDAPAGPADVEARGKEAFAALDEAARVNGAFPGLWVVSGMLREKAGDAARAAEELTRGLEGLAEARGLLPWQVHQLRLFGLLARGRIFLDPNLNRELNAEKDFKEAFRIAEEALKDPAAPRDSRLRRVVLTHLAAAKQRLEYFAEVEKILEFLVQDDPGNPVHSYNLGMVKAQQHDYPKAVECYRRSASLSRTDPRPHLKIAYILLNYPEPGKPHDLDGAAKEAAVYLSLVGAEDAEYGSMRGVIALLREDEAEAERWFRAALRGNPDCKEALSRLVQLLGRREERSPAEEKDLEEFRRRLNDVTQKRNQGEGMETKKSDLTFC